MPTHFGFPWPRNRKTIVVVEQPIQKYLELLQETQAKRSSQYQRSRVGERCTFTVSGTKLHSLYLFATMKKIEESLKFCRDLYIY